MFKELLSIYKSTEDKTDFLKDQIPEDKYSAVITALETEDENMFNNLMGVDSEVSEKVAPETPANDEQVAIAPVDPVETDSIVEESSLPEGPIMEQPEVITEDQQRVILPTLNAVIEMTQSIKDASDDEINALPEDIKEGVEIWKEAGDDFSMKIIATVVDAFHNGDFSEIEVPAGKDILVKGAEIAKELRGQGEHKTSLTRATEDLQKDIEKENLDTLVKVHDELCAIKCSAADLVDDVIYKYDLAVSPSEKESLIYKVIDDCIFEDSTQDELKKDVADILTKSKDYSSRDMSEKFSIFKDFSDIEYAVENASPETEMLIEELGFKGAMEESTAVLDKVMTDNPCAHTEVEIAGDKSVLNTVKEVAKGAKDLVEKNPGKVIGGLAGAALAVPGAVAIGRSEEDDKVGDKVVKKLGAAALVAGGALGGTLAGDKIQDKLAKKGDQSCNDKSCGDKACGDEACKDSSCGDKSKDCSEEVTEEQISEEVVNNALSNDDQIRALVEKYKILPTIEAKDQMKADMKTLGFTDEVINMIEQYAEGNFSQAETKSVDASDETDVASEAVEGPASNEDTVEQVDVSSMVSPELFDELLGPGVGEADPIDGTLPAGEVLAPGTDLGHLGTLDQGIPSGEVVPEDDKDVTKVEIVSSGLEDDGFEDIMR